MNSTQHQPSTQSNYVDTNTHPAFGAQRGLGPSEYTPPAPVGQIGGQLKALDNDIENLVSTINAIARRMVSVTGCEPVIGATPANCEPCHPSVQRVPMTDQLQELRDRLNAGSHALELILNAIEL